MAGTAAMAGWPADRAASPVLPGWRDPRWGSIAILTAFTLLGQTTLHFTVTAAEVLTALGTAVGAELLWQRRRTGRTVVPLSAVITGLGIALLLRSPDIPVFALAGLAGISSKYLIRGRSGRHVFNPSNFGIVVALAFTSGMSDVMPERWDRSALVALGICCIGSFVVFRVRRLLMVATFLAAHAAAAALYAGHLPGWTTSLSASTLIFTFFMITDPRTAPKAAAGQVVYAVAVAGLAQVLVATGSMASLFVALVAVCPLVPLIDRRTTRPAASAPVAPLPAPA